MRPGMGLGFGVLIFLLALQQRCLSQSAYSAAYAAEANWGLKLGLDVYGTQVDEDADADDVSDTHGRSLRAGASTKVKGIPNQFSVRPVIDQTLCVYIVDLASPAGSAAVNAAMLSTLPPSSISGTAQYAHDVDEYGSTRLVLLDCGLTAGVGAKQRTFTTEVVLGGFYTNNLTNYRQALVKTTGSGPRCWYGVNATYTQRFGGPYGSGSEDEESEAEAEEELDWYDEYIFEMAPYFNYNLRGRGDTPLPSAVAPQSVTESTGPKFVTASWGPFWTGYGTCMSSEMGNDPESIVALQYQSWYFINAARSLSIQHLGTSTRDDAFALLTLGPERPQPDMSDEAGHMDAGELSVELGGGDISYGGMYSRKRSNELCLTASSVRPGALLRLSHCDPVQPDITQVFTVTSAGSTVPAKAKKKAANKKKKSL